MRLIMLIELILFCYHMFVYAFKNSQDAILWYKSYDCMRESFSKIAIGILVAIFAINWIVYMFHLVWKSNPNNVNSEAASKVKKCRIIVLILQTVFISAAILYSYYLYSNHIHSNQNYWIFLLIVCTILAAFPLFTYLQKPKST